jgi:hypothetical protein
MRKFILTLFFNILTPILMFSQDTDWFQKGVDATKTKDQIEYLTRSIELRKSMPILESPCYFIIKMILSVRSNFLIKPKH